MFKAHNEIFDQGKSLELTYKFITESKEKIEAFSNLYLSTVLISAFLKNNPQIMSDLWMYIQSFNKISPRTEEQKL